MSPAPRQTQVIEIISRGARASNIALERVALLRLGRYVEMLARWSKVYNLTSVRQPLAIARTHVLDSLAVEPHLQPPDILDIGTGAGLPGLVLAIARPELKFVLLDSRSKRTRFCLQVVGELGLKNVCVVCERAQAYESTTGFSCLVSRASFDVDQIVALGQRLVRPGGRVISMQGRRPAFDGSRLKHLGLGAEVVPLRIHGLAGARHLLVVDLPQNIDAHTTRAVAQ
jgi:16S rRNA (guanine527-N7)-methyltransferase